MTSNLSSPPKAALYCRISQREEGVDKVENQEIRLRNAAEKAGYLVEAVFRDDDISAHKGKNVRPGWLALLAGLKAKQFDVVMATEPQRLTRGSAAELETLQTVCLISGAVIHTISAGIQDPSTPMARAIMSVMDVLGGLEVDLKNERQRNRIEDELSQGKPLWGNRPFGFEIDRLTIREDEAQHIREAYVDVLQGSTLYSIAKRWNQAGIKTTRAGRTIKNRAKDEVAISGLWTTSTIRQVLTRPGVAGILMSRGVVRKTDLPAIVSRSDWELLNAHLADPKRKPRQGSKTKYLLSGILTCQCGGSMTVGTTKYKTTRYVIYRCRKANTPESGTHQFINVALADKAIAREILVWIQVNRVARDDLVGPELNGLLAEHREITRKRGVVQELALMPGADLSAVQTQLADLGAAIERLDAEILEARAGLAGVAMLDGFRNQWWSEADEKSFGAAGEDAMTRFLPWWESFDIDHRREIVRSMFRVRLYPKGSPEIDPEFKDSRMDIDWLIDRQ